MIFFTPENRDHSLLPHDPLKAIVAPRPIGWISTLSTSGVANLAPYSFFNMVGGRPPMLMFSSEGFKDSARNAAETGEFVFNYAGKALEEVMNNSSLPAPSGVSEFDHLGIGQAQSSLVRPPRVADALAACECKVSDVVQIKNVDSEPTGAIMIIGQVMGIHMNETAIRDGRFDVTIAGPVSRLGYLDFGYTSDLHELSRPDWKG